MKITGSHPVCKRIKTGLYSLDHAFINNRGEVGIPVGIGYENFGGTGIGKSTFSYSLAGIIARIQKGDIVLSDFEGYDEPFLESVLSGVEFDGKVEVISEKEDEEQLMKTLDALENPKKDFHVVVLDSISAITPIAEQKGDIGERNMGQRAFAMAQFSRRALHVFRFSDKPKTIIAINHWRAKMGGYGFEAPGGVVKNYLLTARILLKRKLEFPDGSYILEGEVVKNRWGFSNRKFYVFMLAGRGIHEGLTALWDCVVYKQVQYRDEKVKYTLDDGTEVVSSIITFVKAAKRGEDLFDPFRKKLESINADIEDIGTEDEGNESSEMDEISD